MIARVRANYSQRAGITRKWLLLSPALLLISVLFAALAAGGTSTTAQKTVRIAFFSESIANTYTHATEQAIKDVAKKNNATVQVFDANFDSRKQFTQMQDAIASKKFDAFLSVPLDAVGLVPAVAQGDRAGIPFGAISFPLGPNLKTSKPQAKGQWVAVLDPAYSRGLWIGGLVVKACGKQNPCNVAYIGGNPAVPFGKGALDAIRATIKPHGNIKIVAVQPGGYLSGPALKAMQNILQANRDINVVASDGDQMIQGSILALNAAGIKYGLKADEVKVIGLGASVASVNGIKAGKWFGTALSLPYDEGRIATTLIIQAARGQLKKPKGLSAAIASGRNPMVTRANIGNLKPQWRG